MSNLKAHQELIGKILHYLFDQGLRKSEINSDMADEFYKGTSLEGLGDFEVLSDVVDWMEHEGIISIANNFKAMGGAFSNYGVQLTSTGISMIQQQTFAELEDKTIEQEIEQSNGDISAEKYGKIGSLIGGFVGGLSQSFN
ncbi:hypothetical protein [Pseudovibrio sp. SCP19]|uniref:hypothetical protein n=1 Tax=Pseudovibrio sp. SCP19 TaxID=3141374 RepID=UPI0033359D17